jgi:hypothetical protein
MNNVVTHSFGTMFGCRAERLTCARGESAPCGAWLESKLGVNCDSKLLRQEIKNI